MNCVGLKKQTSLMIRHINVVSGIDLTIKEFVGFKGEIYFDLSKPDGNSRKLLDSKRINNIDFKPQITLKQGLKQNYQNFIKINANF
jgi:GDP-L-fucose synthase